MEDKQRKMLIDLCIVLGIILTLTTGWAIYDKTVDRSGWIHKDGLYAYKDFHGKKVSGWLDLEGDTYFFGPDCIMVTGWQDLDGSRYYFGTDGIMDTGWKSIDGLRYFFGSDGILCTGWLDLEENRYYLGTDGAMVTGWQVLGQHTYYFDEEGIMATDWRVLDGETYYFQPTGDLVTGYVTLEEKNYYFLDNGIMFYGWEETEHGRRYYARDGAQVFDWAEIDEKWYFFGQEGFAHTGWYQDGEYIYYFLEDGSAAAGPHEINGQLYHFTPKGIMVVLVNGDHSVPDYYKPELETFRPWHQVAAVALEPLKQMLADCEAAGYPYEFNSAYRSIQTQSDILYTRTQEHIALGYSEAEAYEQARLTVALPGTSEHHLGLAVDVLNVENAARQALEWLGAHCWEYGFILRYTEEKAAITGIIHEPWHFRYVGTRVSMEMKDSGLCLEEYLGAAAVSNSTISAAGVS